MVDFSTFDCETDPFKNGRVPKPFIWGHYNHSEGFKYFFETEDFVNFIRERKEIIYAHNGGKFDLHFLWPFIEPQERIMIVDSRVARIKIGHCEIRDSFMLFPIPLKSYKKDDFDYEKMEEQNRKNNMQEIHSYLKSDCVYLYELLLKNFELYGQKISLASSAFSFWHKKFSHLKIKPRTGQGFFEIFKPYYYGGRVECFEKGIIEKPFDVFDIRSAYPRAMLEEHAYGNEFVKGKTLPDSNIEFCFAEIRAKSHGILPFRNKGLTFPCDNEYRNYFATGWEIKTGLETGKLHIDKVIHCRKFLNTINFKDYVNYFYKEKEEMRNVDQARYLLAKLYLNSLYGKFGQNPNDHKDYELIEPRFIHSFLEQGYQYENLIGKYALMSRPIEEEKKLYYNVATAASITGFVRSFLFRTILSCDNPLYCDTDSLACQGFKGEIGEQIGQWNHEGNFKRGAIAGKKLYAFEYEKNHKKAFKISSKGVRLTPAQIFAIAKGEEIEYKSEAPTFSIKNQPKFISRRINKT